MRPRRLDVDEAGMTPEERLGASRISSWQHLRRMTGQPLLWFYHWKIELELVWRRLRTTTDLGEVMVALDLIRP